MNAFSLIQRPVGTLSRLLCFAVAGLVLAACGGGDDGGNGAYITHQFDGVWTGTLVTENMPPMPAGTELEFEQFIYGDRVMQRYPPSYSLITDGRQQVIGTHQRGGTRDHEVTGSVRNYVSKAFLAVTRFQSLFVDGDRFSSTVSDAGFSGTLSGEYEPVSRQAVTLADVVGSWYSIRVDSYGSITIDAAGAFTGELNNCVVEDGQISELEAGLNLFGIRFSWRCPTAESTLVFDGLMRTESDGTKARELRAIVTEPEYAFGLDFFR